MTDPVVTPTPRALPSGSEVLTLRRLPREGTGGTSPPAATTVPLPGFDWREESRHPVAGQWPREAWSQATCGLANGGELPAAVTVAPAGAASAAKAAGAVSPAGGSHAVVPSTAGTVLEVLLIPAVAGENPTPGDWLAATRAVGSGGAALARGAGEAGPGWGEGVQFALHGAQVAWSGDRGVVVALRDRWEAVTRAVAEFSHYALELADVEQGLAQEWERQRVAVPGVFEFDHAPAGRLREIDASSARLLELRRRVVQVVPLVQRPPQFPPTLAGQIGERLRERTRMAERVEHAQQQLDQLERVRDVCGQRLAELQSSRKGHMLEMIIIALLGFQLLLWMAELLFSTGSE
ncbi:MAG: hypothetical protein ACKOGA_02050 [Planctomycetaceae bacterium]